jgi:hypothetical protein
MIINSKLYNLITIRYDNKKHVLQRKFNLLLIRGSLVRAQEREQIEKRGHF